MEANKIQELVLCFMKSLEIKCENDGKGIWRAKIIPSERTFFNGFEEYVFTFEREVAEKHRELELICDGSYLLKKIIERLASIPKVSRLFALTPPEPPSDGGKVGELVLLAPGKCHYRQKINFHFKVSYVCNRRYDSLFTCLVDPASNEVYLKEGVNEIDMSSYSETPNPDIPIEPTGEEILRLYLKACQILEEETEKKLGEIKSWAQTQFEYEKEKIEEFIDEQKAELEKKKANVCFHLYFFQKEEEIDKMINDLENEKLRKIQELQEKHSLKIEISLINAYVLCVPTLGIPASMVSRKKHENSLKPLTERFTVSDNFQVIPTI
ncbi:MAG: hypothetical protein HQM08_03740 [Candidatus Riflebacteria bacterium]|nr:hypothetical protein [Candidatus Riflebacteria bacterium]